VEKSCSSRDEREIVFGSKGIKAAYNYMTNHSYSSLEKLARHFDSFGVDYPKLLDSDEISIALEIDEIRDLGKELFSIKRTSFKKKRLTTFNFVSLFL